MPPEQNTSPAPVDDPNANQSPATAAPPVPAAPPEPAAAPTPAPTPATAEPQPVVNPAPQQEKPLNTEPVKPVYAQSGHPKQTKKMLMIAGGAVLVLVLATVLIAVTA